MLCAGVVQTPQILELSGIGDPEVLRAAGVECKVENKAVGANFQDHVLGGILFDLKRKYLHDPALLERFDCFHMTNHSLLQPEWTV